MAAGIKIDKGPGRVYCIVGDGETCEGQVWEASHAASFYKLDNLVAILDYNGLMTNGPVCDRYNTTPYPEKWRAFGWHVVEVDGHDIKALLEVFDAVDEIKGKPKMIVARTTKAKGVAFAEGRAEFHNGIMNREQYDAALVQFGGDAEGPDAATAPAARAAK